MKQSLRITGCVSWLFVAGCGTDLGEALLFAGDSAGRTFIDVLISDFYSDAPELVTFPGRLGDATDDDAAPEETAADMDAEESAPLEEEDIEDIVDLELAGDADRGVAVFTANFCTACHCDDASGGCLPTAPDVRGTNVTTLQEKLQGDEPHVGGTFPDLTAQDLADLQAFLAQ